VKTRGSILAVMLTALLSSGVVAKESCTLKDLELESASRAQKLFYEGTCH
jgi:hypothetical protein